MPSMCFPPSRRRNDLVAPAWLRSPRRSPRAAFEPLPAATSGTPRKSPASSRGPPPDGYSPEDPRQEGGGRSGAAGARWHHAPIITDKKLVALAEQYALAAPEKNRLEKFLKEAKPVLLQAMRDAPTAYVGNRVVTRTDVVGTPDTVGEKITRAMVGQHMLGKKGRPQSRTRSAADAPAARPEVVPATSACLATPDPTAADPSSNHPSSRVLRRPFESAEYRFAVLAQARYPCAAGGVGEGHPGRLERPVRLAPRDAGLPGLGLGAAR
jgi:hypothetical protein